MFDWFSNLLDPVINWVVDVAGEEVAAVVGGALAGATTGAIIGAARAAISGDDILSGALDGAQWGGIAGGVISTVGQLSGAESFSAESQLEAMGFTGSPAQNIEQNLAYSPAPVGDPGSPTSSNFNADVTSPSGAFVPEAAGSSFSPETGKILAGVGQGAAAGAGNYLAAGAAADAKKELANEDEKRYYDRIAANRPGEILNKQTANIRMAPWWDKHINKTKQGILNSEVA
jgi:hypothetical protein